MSHGHNGDAAKANQPSYGYKLWLAHGVTTVRGVSFYFGPNQPDLTDTPVAQPTRSPPRG